MAVIVLALIAPASALRPGRTARASTVSAAAFDAHRRAPPPNTAPGPRRTPWTTTGTARRRGRCVPWSTSRRNAASSARAPGRTADEKTYRHLTALDAALRRA
ncbi:hypothetical protein OIM90_10140 [Streptomyces sp. AD16]|nr:hypothetical protein OIM90_10140 [Streptomyces sp. AD16]